MLIYAVIVILLIVYNYFCIPGALEDFNAPPKKNEKAEPAQKKQNEVARPTPPDSLWNEEFLQQTTARLEQMQSLFSPGNKSFLKALFYAH